MFVCWLFKREEIEVGGRKEEMNRNRRKNALTNFIFLKDRYKSPVTSYRDLDAQNREKERWEGSNDPEDNRDGEESPVPLYDTPLYSPDSRYIQERSTRLLCPRQGLR